MTEPEPNRTLLWENSYSKTKFTMELSFLIFTLLLWAKLIQHTLAHYTQAPLTVVLGFILAQFIVDFVSGMLHWACDTWGHFETPIVGPTLIRSFRMHHVDPQDITRHGFV
jgi:ubiquitin-conjugating enzyme E2 variant